MTGAIFRDLAEDYFPFTIELVGLRSMQVRSVMTVDGPAVLSFPDPDDLAEPVGVIIRYANGCVHITLPEGMSGTIEPEGTT